MATNAGDVLSNATVHPTLENAIEDCVAAYALSARPREWSPQVLDARAAAAHALKTDGRRRSCSAASRPGSPTRKCSPVSSWCIFPPALKFNSLNLAQAVQVVAYELFTASGSSVLEAKSEKLATVQDLEGLYAHLHDAAVKSGFHVPATGSKLPSRLRRSSRAFPSSRARRSTSSAAS